MLKKIILCLSLMISVTTFSQKVLRSEEKVVCKWNEYSREFENCINSRANMQFFFNSDYSIMYSMGDVEATFYLDEGVVDGNIITFHAGLPGNETCVIFLDSKNGLVKFMFRERGQTLLVTYIL